MSDSVISLSEMLCDLSLQESEPPHCKGLFFKGYSSLFYTGTRIERREGLRLLKRKSCKGCPSCSWFLGEINEMIECNSLIIPNSIEEDSIYSIRVTNEGRDYETGLVDEYDFEIYKVEEPTK